MHALTIEDGYLLTLRMESVLAELGYISRCFAATMPKAIDSAK